MKLEDAGIARDEREGTTLRASATVGYERDTSEATRIALTSLIRQADEKGLVLDVATIATKGKKMNPIGTTHTRILVVCSALAY